ncbi:hypothetical protein Bca101_010212 [Brassica carinata]
MVEVVNLIDMTVRDTMIIPHERIIWMPFHSKRPVLTIGNMVEMTVMIIIPDEQGIGMGISMVRLGHRLQDMDVDILPMSIRNSKNGEINSTKPRILKRSDKGNASRSSGKNLASTIVTPSRIEIQNEENVTVRDRGIAREFTFSLMEKEGHKNSHDEE